MQQKWEIMITGSLPISATPGIQSDTQVDSKNKTTPQEQTHGKVGEFQHLLKQSAHQLEGGKNSKTKLGDLSQLLAKLEAKVSGKEAGITFSKEELQKLVSHFQKTDLPANVKESVLNQLNSSLKDQLSSRVIASSSNQDFKEIVDALRTKTGKEDVHQLIEALRSDNTQDYPVDGHSEGLEETQNVESAEASPMEFLLKGSKGSEAEGTKKTQFMHSEDFANLKSEKPILNKNIENLKNEIQSNQVAQKKNEANDVESLIKNLTTSSSAHSKMPAQGEIKVADILRSDKTTVTAKSDRKKEMTLEDILAKDNTAGMREIASAQIARVDNSQIATQDGQKVLDLSKLNTSNTNEIINNISNYIQQNQIMNRDSLDLNVHHQELGQFKINVSKNTADKSNAIDLQIMTSTAEGHEFFSKHEVALMKNLSQAGVQLAEFKIVAGNENASMAQNDSRQNQQQQGQSDQKQNMKFSQGDSSEGSQRRKDLWQQAQNFQKFGA